MQNVKTIFSALKNNNIVLGCLAACVLFMLSFALTLVVVHLSRTPKASTVATTEPVLTTPFAPASSLNLSAKAFVVYDLTTNQPLYEMNSETQLPLASLTKLVSLYASANVLSETNTITLTHGALEPEGDSGFSVGESFSYTDLAKASIVASSNDAVEALVLTAAHRIEVSPEALMASAVKAIGLTQTFAVNGTGLDENLDLSGGYGSAHDIALLSGSVLSKMPHIAQASTEDTVTIHSTAGKSFTFKNTNPDVSTISGLLFSKTGLTDLAGGNLAVIYDAGIQHPIAIVVLGSTKEERFTDVEKLINATRIHFTDPTPL